MQFVARCGEVKISLTTGNVAGSGIKITKFIE